MHLKLIFGLKIVVLKNIILVLENKYLGTLAVKDDRSSIIFNGNFPPSSPTIFFENTVLTSGLHMTFSSSLDIIEIEVFGGMYEQYVSTF